MASFAEWRGDFSGPGDIGEQAEPMSLEIRDQGVWQLPRGLRQMGKGSRQWCPQRCVSDDHPSHRPGMRLIANIPSRVVFSSLA